jgi:hypothetical protein
MNKIEVFKQIQSNINKLSENEIIEIFKIINESNTNYTKNNNGIFFNLNWVDDAALEKIHNYITFCIKSQNEISKYEIMKNLLNDSIKTKDKLADESQQTQESSDQTVAPITNKQKSSSSMKFYLLKKKYMKQNNIPNITIDNELSYEEYIM